MNETLSNLMHPSESASGLSGHLEQQRIRMGLPENCKFLHRLPGGYVGDYGRDGLDYDDFDILEQQREPGWHIGYSSDMFYPGTDVDPIPPWNPATGERCYGPLYFLEARIAGWGASTVLTPAGFIEVLAPKSPAPEQDYMQAGYVIKSPTGQIFTAEGYPVSFDEAVAYVRETDAIAYEIGTYGHPHDAVPPAEPVDEGLLAEQMTQVEFDDTGMTP